MEDQKKHYLERELQLLEELEESELPSNIVFYAPKAIEARYLPTVKSIALNNLFPRPVHQRTAINRCSKRGISAYFMAVNDPRFKQP